MKLSKWYDIDILDPIFWNITSYFWFKMNEIEQMMWHWHEYLFVGSVNAFCYYLNKHMERSCEIFILCGLLFIDLDERFWMYFVLPCV